MPMSSELQKMYDYSFERSFVGNKQMQILHKFKVDAARNLWHVVTMDSNEHYDSSFWILNPETWEFTYYSSQIVGRS